MVIQVGTRPDKELELERDMNAGGSVEQDPDGARASKLAALRATGAIPKNFGKGSSDSTSPETGAKLAAAVDNIPDSG